MANLIDLEKRCVNCGAHDKWEVVSDTVQVTHQDGRGRVSSWDNTIVAVCRNVLTYDDESGENFECRHEIEFTKVCEKEY